MVRQVPDGGSHFDPNFPPVEYRRCWHLTPISAPRSKELRFRPGGQYVQIVGRRLSVLA